MTKSKFSRRDFFKAGTIGGASLVAGAGFSPERMAPECLSDNSAALVPPVPELPSRYALDLTPARWIWYPSQRTLANTFILFRKPVSIQKEIEFARGWILGDSRYLLTVNENRVQWGPPPSDPRFSEADPIELAEYLTKGENVIGSTVLYYGYGDGTWPMGKPGFIFYLKIGFKDGSDQTITSDSSWFCHVARSWNPGHYKRWYLRALQEEFDARLYPIGWTNTRYKIDSSWINAEILDGDASKPALSANSNDYMYNSSSIDTVTELRRRTIPLLKESDHRKITLEESYWVKWNRSPQEYFEMIVPHAYETIHETAVRSVDGGSWQVVLDEWHKGAVLTFSFEEQMVGWPFFTVEAPEGTIIELMVQEGHRLFRDGGPAIMNNHFHSWTRFICKAGENYFQPFDFESVKWIQLHIYGILGEVIIKDIGLKRRMYDWPNKPIVHTSDKNLQKLVDASLNTIYNNSQDTIVDGMGRERQQYSGDIGHVLHALYRVFGEQELPARYLNTFSQGLTEDGFFMDTWPAYDRLNRLAQRQLGLTPWGPLLDHGVGFNFDCYHHYLYTGRLYDLEEVWPRLEMFFPYLRSITGEDGLLPVENFGIPTVWIDHDAYEKQRDKQCAFNLYTSAMLLHAFAPLAIAFGKSETAREAKSFGDRILTNTIKKYWDTSKKTFICNKPWKNEEGKELLCDRSLSTAILFDLCPNLASHAVVDALLKKPTNLGLSYPPNANWYLWALGKSENIDAIFKDFEERWIKMDSVHQNNTMQESWVATPDSNSQWSHASIAPLFVVYMNIAGIQPLKPGYKHFRIFPQPGKLEFLELANHTPHGPINFSLSGKRGNRRLKLGIPEDIAGELILNEKEKVKLKELYASDDKKAYELQGGTEVEMKLKYT